MKNRRSRKNAPCPDRNLFEKSFLDELGRDEVDRFLEHVSQCPRCRKTFEVMNAIKAELNSKSTAIPERLSHDQAQDWRRLAGDRLAEIECSGKKSAGKSPLAWVLSVKFLAPAAILIVLFAAGYVFILSPIGRHEGLRNSDPVELRLLAPIGKIAASPDAFSWTRVQGAENYVFNLIDEKLNRIYYSDELEDTTSIPVPEEVKKQLVRGATYVWTVTATDENSNKLDSKSASFVID
jgi:hypothetical protein